MQLKKEKLRNFARFSDFEVEFDEKVTHLVGINGSGKSTVGLTAIWAGLKGIAEKNSTGQMIGERFRFIGRSGASADIELTLHDAINDVDVVVKNHMTANTNQITFSAPEGYITDPAWLNNLLNVSFLSAKNFSVLSPKEQALTLGIDVEAFDIKIKSIKEVKKSENSKLLQYKNLVEIPKVEKMLMTDLFDEKAKLDARKEADKKLNDTREYYIQMAIKLSDEYNKAIDGVREGVQSNEIRLSDDVSDTIRIIPQFHKELLDLLEEFIPQLPELDKTLDADLEAYQKKIKGVDETNRQADEYFRYLEKVEAKKKIETAIVKLDKELEKLNTERVEHIKKTNLGFSGLSIDGDGGLLFDEGNGLRPIKEPYYSKGQLEIIVARLYAATNPALKVRFIDDFDSLDEDNQVKIIKFLLEDGFQVITSSVGKVAKHENSIILRECMIKEYDTKQKPNILE